MAGTADTRDEVQGRGACSRTACLITAATGSLWDGGRTYAKKDNLLVPSERQKEGSATAVVLAMELVPVVRSGKGGRCASTTVPPLAKIMLCAYHEGKHCRHPRRSARSRTSTVGPPA